MRGRVRHIIEIASRILLNKFAVGGATGRESQHEKIASTPPAAPTSARHGFRRADAASLHVAEAALSATVSARSPEVSRFVGV